MRVLIAEDDPVSAALLKSVLHRNGYETTMAADGKEAQRHLQMQSFDAVLTDWMMPEMDGIQLIREIRRTCDPVPLIVMVTAIGLTAARDHALDAGADIYIQKPFFADQVLASVRDGLAQHSQPSPKRLPRADMGPSCPPSYVGVGIAASTGGPVAVSRLLQKIPPTVMFDAAVFVVLHGPDWMLTSFSSRLEKETGIPVLLGSDKMTAEPGTIYLAPGDHHMTLAPKSGMVEVEINRGPKENYIRPAVDPLFRGLAATFGQYAVAAVLTGMGKDGTKGAAHITAAGGTVLAQEPSTATAPSMPSSVIAAGLATQKGSLTMLGTLIGKHVDRLSKRLKAESRVPVGAGR